jgi:hypothetical protein
MYRTLALAAAVAALSVPAFASDITVTLAGKPKAQVVAEIHSAAIAVCRDDGYILFDEQLSCVAEVEGQALTDLQSAYAVQKNDVVATGPSVNHARP